MSLLRVSGVGKMGAYSERLARAEYYLSHGEFELCTMLCGKAMELLLKDILEKYLNIADERQRTVVKGFLSDHHKNSMERMTAGQIVTLFLKINVIETFAKRLSLDLEVSGLLNLREMVDIRNRATHNEVQDRTQEKADAFVMYGNLLRLSRVANSLLIERARDNKDTSQGIFTSPEPNRSVPRSVLVSGNHFVATPPRAPESLTLLRNRASGKYFIHLEDESSTKILLVTPDGLIKGLEENLFDEPKDVEKELAVNQHLVSKEQVQKYHDYVVENVRGIRERHRSTKPEILKGISPPSYHRPLGSRGNSNLEDYLIPVIKLMNEGRDYRDVFHAEAKRLDVRYTTVSAQCTRALGLTTEEFVAMVKDERIINLLGKKYPDQVALIRRELVKS